MNLNIDHAHLEATIAEAYRERVERFPKTAFGWRLLYSPRSVLSNARVAFVGFNPGGGFDNPEHGQFCSEAGSAYRKEVEDWGSSSGLQAQVVALFDRLNVVPEDVLAGNLVPFRSPRENSLDDIGEAIAFGRGLWKEILDRAKPQLIVTMGRFANREIADLLSVRDIQKHPIGWGNYTASRGVFENGNWVGLPHLSRFAIMRRAASQNALDDLFAGLG